MNDSTLKGIESHSAILAIIGEHWQPTYEPAAKPKPGQEDLLFLDDTSRQVYTHKDMMTLFAIWMLSINDMASRPARLAYVYGAPCPEESTAEAHERYIKRRKEAAAYMEEMLPRLDALFAKEGPQAVMDAMAPKIEKLSELTGLRIYATGASITKTATCPPQFVGVKTEIKLYGEAKNTSNHDWGFLGKPA